MSPGKEDACKDGLTPECFEEFPEFARQLFFLRLLYLLFPAQVSFKLPAKFRDLIFRPGPAFPPGWRYGDPWPDQAFTWEGLNMPPYDLLPYDLTVRPEFPNLSETGPLPPYHFDALGLYSMALSWRQYMAGTYFYDHFVTSTDNDWTLTPPIHDGTLTISGTNLLFNSWGGITTGFASATIDAAPADDFDIIFEIWYTAGYNYMYFLFDTGVYYVQIYFDYPDSVRLRKSSGFETISVEDFRGSSYAWKLEVRGDQVTLYQSHAIYHEQWTQRGPTCTLDTVSLNPHRITFFFWDLAVIYVDSLIIDADV